MSTDVWICITFLSLRMQMFEFLIPVSAYVYKCLNFCAEVLKVKRLINKHILAKNRLKFFHIKAHQGHILNGLSDYAATKGMLGYPCADLNLLKSMQGETFDINDKWTLEKIADFENVFISDDLNNEENDLD